MDKDRYRQRPDRSRHPRTSSLLTDEKRDKTVTVCHADEDG